MIDFCLVKELRCNYRTSSEILMLNWASKASCNQRSGRAGRVKEGIVFRLVDSSFFNKGMDSFSTPEILRCPLEKVILRLKVWNKDEPDKILGRTIEPPDFKNYEAGLDNLINNGAITIRSKNHPSGQLTNIGKVFAELPLDIKYSRLIMIAYSLGLVEPGIVLASILNQDKNLIRIDTNNIDLFELDFLKTIDLGCNSDILALFNLYKWWERKFSIKAKENKEFDRRKINYGYESSIWCRARLTKDYMMQDVERTIADLKNRLNKLGYYEPGEVKKYDIFSLYIENPKLLDYQLIDKNSLVTLYRKYNKVDELSNKEKEKLSILCDKKFILSDMLYYDEDSNNDRIINLKENKILNNYDKTDLLFMKIVISGAFNGKFIESTYKDIDKFNKTKQNFDKNFDIQRTIRIKNLPEDVTERELQDFIQSYFPVKVDKLEYSGGDALLMIKLNHSDMLIEDKEKKSTVIKEESDDFNIKIEGLESTNLLDDLKMPMINGFSSAIPSFSQPFLNIPSLGSNTFNNKIKLEYDNSFISNDRFYYYKLILRETISRIITMINSSLIFDKYYKKIKNFYENTQKKYYNSYTARLDRELTNRPRAVYLYQLSFSESFKDREVIISPTSVNSELVEPNENKVHKNFIIGEEFYERNNRSPIARKTTLMPDNEMGNLLMTLIFAPQVKFLPNSDKTKYDGFKVIGSDKTFRFPYLFSSVDIDDINKIRKYINIVVDNIKEKSIVERARTQLKENLVKIWVKKRIKIIKNPHWWKIYNYYFGKKDKTADQSKFKKIYNEELEKMSKLEFEDGILTENEIDKYDIEQLNNHQNKGYYISSSNEDFKPTKENNDFLPLLAKLKINEDFRLWCDKGIQDLEKERKEFEMMKKKLELELQRNKNLCVKENAQVLCNECSSYITSLKQLKQINISKIAYEIVGYVASFINVVDSKSEEMNKFKNDHWLIKFKKSLTQFEPDQYLFCKQNHIIGYCFEGRNIVTIYSNLKVNYPTDHEENLEQDLNEMKEKELLYQNKRLTELTKLSCILCEEYRFDTPQAYKKHLEDVNHTRNLNELLEECFY